MEPAYSSCCLSSKNSKNGIFHRYGAKSGRTFKEHYAIYLGDQRAQDGDEKLYRTH